MKIAIVENETVHVQQLQNQLLQWEVENGTELSVEIFSNGSDLLNADFTSFNLIFMDIQMDGVNGVQTSHSLRSLRYEGEIVFLTSFYEYVFDGYDVRALNFILKPPEFLKVAKCLDYVRQKVSEGFHIYSNQTTVVQIPYSDILYLTSSNHYTQIVTKKDTYRQLEPMKNVHATLPSRFLYCHRTIIVNVEHILTMIGKEIVLSNHAKIPVSNTHVQAIRSAIFRLAENVL